MHQIETEGQKPVSGIMHLEEVKMQKGILSGKRHNAKRHNAKRDNAKRNNAKGQNAKRHNAKRHNAKRHNAKRHNAKRHNANRHNAKRYNAKRHNAIRHHAKLSVAIGKNWACAKVEQQEPLFVLFSTLRRWCSRG